MSKRWIKAGVTDQTIDLFILDSSSTTGAGLTGLTSGSSGLTCYYRKGATGTAQALTLASQTVGGAHTDGGFVAIDGTNMPGLYRLDLSDTMVAAEGMLTILLKGATNMAPVVAELEIVDIDIYDSVRLGLTALPNAAAEASGGLATLSAAQSGNGTIPVNLKTIAGQTANAAAAVTFPASIGTSTLDAAGAADAVWDEPLSGHLTSGSTGAALNAAGAAGDPWSTSIPGAYGAGTAGYIVGTNLDAAITSRLASGNVTVGSIATNAITNSSIQNGAITTLKFAAGAITSAVLGDNSITADKIAAGAITASEVSTEAAQEIANAVWSANITNDYAISPASSTAWANDTMGKRVLRSSGNTDATEAVVADAVWEEPRGDHDTGNTMGHSLDQIRKANFTTEGIVNSTTGATTTSFRTNLTGVNDTYQHQTILFVNSAALNGQSAPILSYAQTNGVITLGDGLTVAPSLNDEFVILPTHVYPMSYIVTNILEGNTSTTSYAAGDVGNILARLHNMIEADGADFRYTTNALEQAPSGGGGGGGWALNADQTTGLKRVISAIVGVGGETATPGVLEFDMVGESTTLRITQSTDGNDRLTVEEV